MKFNLKNICCDACRKGQTDIVKWIIMKYNLNICKKYLQYSCYEGHLELSKWLVETKRNKIYPLDKHGSPSKFHRFRGKTIRDILKISAGSLSGGINILKWIIEEFDIEAKYLFKLKILTSLCGRGEFEVFQWLIERYTISSDDIKNYSFNILRASCSSGNKDNIKYVLENFKIEKKGLIGNENEILYKACKCGNLEIVKYLTKKFSLTREDLIDSGNILLFAAFKYERKEVIKWLLTEGKLTESDAQEAFRFVYYSGKLNSFELDKLIRFINNFYGHVVVRKYTY